MPQKCCKTFFLNRYSLDLSKEVIYGLADQWAAKLKAVKVGAVQESNQGRPKTNVLLRMIADSASKS